MSIPFKKTKRVNPKEPQEEGLYYPQLLTLGKRLTEEDIIYRIKEKTSLSKGDILSVVSSFIDETRLALFDGYSVNYRDFGVFSLAAKGEGAATEKECTANNIKSVRITFRAASTARPNLSSTRAGDRLSFVDLQTYLKGLAGGLTTGSDNGGTGSGDDDGGFTPDPNA